MISQESFNRLLAHLDSDRDRAGERYELVRSQLIKFFECRGCLSAVDLTDETFNRVARRLSEGQVVPPESLISYFYGVARYILKEYLRDLKRKTSTIEELTLSGHPFKDSGDREKQHTEGVTMELRINCLEKCLDDLAPETRLLLISYDEGKERARIKNRQRIADSLGISPNSLRIRIHRIREKLEKCITHCLNQSSRK